jgi:AcrR family transcriptional regulator
VSSEKPSLRERKKKQTRADILRAAVSLFEERGFEDTNVDDIVERANYSRTTFFRLFGSKEDVLFADIGDQLDALRARLAEASDQEPIEGVREVLTTMFMEYAEPDRAHVVRLWLSEPALQRGYRQIYAGVEDAVTRHLMDGWGSEDEDAAIDARVLAIAMTGVGITAADKTLSVDNPDPDQVRRALNRGFDLLEEGSRREHGSAASA